MNQNIINPDEICQRAVQAKLDVYKAKEHFETILKNYNDAVDALIGVINLMKRRIIKLENSLKERNKKKQ